MTVPPQLQRLVSLFGDMEQADWEGGTAEEK